MSYVKTPVILDRKLLNDGLHTLFTNFAADLSTEFSLPAMPDAEVQALCNSTASYLKHFVGDNRRRSKKPLRPKDLELHILRTRNPAEERKIKDEDGKTKYVKGEKKWYRLVLFETTTITTTVSAGKGKKKNEERIDVQTLAEGSPRLAKASVLSGFQDAIEKKVEKWENAEKERTKKLKKEADARRRATGTRKKPGPPKGRVEKSRGKKRKVEKEESEDEDEDAELEFGGLDDVREEEEDDDGGWGMGEDEEFDPMMYKAKKKSGSQGGVSRKSALGRLDGSTDAQSTGSKRRRLTADVKKNVYGYNSGNGEYEGIRVKKRSGGRNARFEDEVLGNEV